MPNTVTEILDRLERALRARNRTHDANEINYWVGELDMAISDLHDAKKKPEPRYHNPEIWRPSPEDGMPYPSLAPGTMERYVHDHGGE